MARTFRSLSRRLREGSSSSLSSERSSVGFLSGSLANETPRDRGVPASRALRSSSLSLPHRTPDAPSPRSRLSRSPRLSLSRSRSRSESCRVRSAERSTFEPLPAPRLSACFSKLSIPDAVADDLGDWDDLRGVRSPTPSSLSGGLWVSEQEGNYKEIILQNLQFIKCLKLHQK